MRARLLAGPAALADYEIVEMLLFLAIPRRDTKPLAKSLVLRFGGLREVLSATPEALLALGVPARLVEVFAAVTDAASQLAEADARRPEVLADRAAVAGYLAQPRRGRRPGRSVLLLDSRNRLVGDERCDGPDPAAIASLILRRALAHHATAALLVRETAGPAALRDADHAVFREVRRRAEPLSVLVHDLMVIGPDGRWVGLAGAV
jgi:DNA repair protein RadC